MARKRKLTIHCPAMDIIDAYRAIDKVVEANSLEISSVHYVAREVGVIVKFCHPINEEFTHRFRKMYKEAYTEISGRTI